MLETYLVNHWFGGAMRVKLERDDLKLDAKVIKLRLLENRRANNPFEVSKVGGRNGAGLFCRCPHDPEHLDRTGSTASKFLQQFLSS